MTRLFAAPLAAVLVLAAPATAATRTADGARAADARLSPMGQPIRAMLRQSTLRPSPQSRSRYDLSRMMARNFGSVGQRQLDVLVASIQ